MRITLLVLALATVLHAQGEQPAQAPTDPLSDASVRATLSHLASDAMEGRDTPSRGLEAAADWIEARFKTLGLKPGAGESYSHTYELPGLEFATQADFTLRVGRGEDARDLVAGEEVRLFRAHAAIAEEDITLDRYDAANTDPKLQRRAQGARRPLLIEVAEDSGIWKSATETKRILKPRFRPRAPIFLVKKGLLPEGKLKGRVSVRAPKEVKLKLRNIVGVLPGTKRKNERIVFSAHYDHIGFVVPRGGDGLNNGADDDATGTTAVLQLAAAFAKTGPRERTLVFTTFSAEEKGLLGSKAFAENPPFPLKSVIANLNLEMLGRPGKEEERKTVWMTGRDYSDLEKILAPGFKRAGIKLREFEMQRQLFGASDNFSLAMKGVVAQSISGGGLHKDYHQPSDEVEKIDIEHMSALIRGIYEAAGDLADSKKKPKYNAKGKKAIAPRRRRR